MRRLTSILLHVLLLLLLLLGATAPPALGAPYASTSNEAHVWVRDNVFKPPQVKIPVGDLLRQDGATGRRMGWMAVVLLLPIIGPIAYWAVAKSPVPKVLRFGLVGVPILVTWAPV